MNGNQAFGRVQVAHTIVLVQTSLPPVEEILRRLAGTEVVAQLEDVLQLLGLHQLPQTSVWVDVEVVH